MEEQITGSIQVQRITAKVSVKSISAEVVTGIAKVTEKLAQHGSHDLTEPIAELADLAARVSAMGNEGIEAETEQSTTLSATKKPRNGSKGDT